MRTILRAGAIALAAGSLLLGSAAAAQAAAPAGTVTVSVNRLILEPGEFGHSGTIRIVIKNRTTEPYDSGVVITEPIAKTIDTSAFTGTGPCGVESPVDGRSRWGCMLENPIAPGANAVVTVGFRSPSKPETFPRIASTQGTVSVPDEVPTSSATFDAVFRSSTGRLANPVPYTQDTEAKLAVTAGDVTLSPQEDGTYRGSTAVTVRNNGDAPNSGLGAYLAVPAGLADWPALEPSNFCGPTDGPLTPPPGGFLLGCGVSDQQFAEGQELTFTWVFTAPAGTAAGPFAAVTTQVTLNGAPDQTDGASVATFNLTVAG